ncbi:putative lipid droplet-associated hydrolase [Helianthus anomalus]
MTPVILNDMVAYFIALYPFLAVNARSQQQSIIKKISRSRLQSNLISATVALLGFLPISASRFIAKMSLGKSWSATAIDALCKGVLKYHTMCNVLYLAMTEFEEVYNLSSLKNIKNNHLNNNKKKFKKIKNS